MKHTDKDENSTSKKPSRNILSHIFQGWILAYQDIRSIICGMQTRSENIGFTLATMLLSVIVTWFIYVPIHELMHVAGCVFTGGTVSELLLGREYGAVFLQKIFPFISAQTTQYAGRLTGFNPAGDISYFICVFAPFILTVFPGIWFILQTKKNLNPLMLGPSLVIGLAPFTNLTGDYFEMGTIASTRLINFFGRGIPVNRIDLFWDLRSDDLFRLFGEIFEAPSKYGLNSMGGIIATSLVILIGIFLAVAISGWTYQLGRWLTTTLFPKLTI